MLPKVTQRGGRDETGEQQAEIGFLSRGTADEHCANGSATFTFQDNACPAFPASAAFEMDAPILVWFVSQRGLPLSDPPAAKN